MCTRPTAKRQKRAPRAPDRVTLDVGGTEFVAAASTLSAHSAYFASLFSDCSDARSESGGGGEVFLDRDPVAFGKLLAYMRRGMIEVEDVDAGVLALAEFLGVEQLLLAAKVRWYYNIGKGPVFKEDEDIADAFDERYGGVLNAVSAGLFPHFLERDDVDAEKEYSVVRVRSPDGFNGGTADDDMGCKCYSVDEGVNTDSPHLGIECDSFVGALNGIFANGYTVRESQLDRHCPSLMEAEATFSRRKHSPLRYKKAGGATDIFIPTSAEARRNRDGDHTKQFAMLAQVPHDAYDVEDECRVKIFAPRDCPDPYASEMVEGNDDNRAWLQAHNFVTREGSLEEVVENCLGFRQENHVCRIYSRRIPLLPRETY